MMAILMISPAALAVCGPAANGGSSNCVGTAKEYCQGSTVYYMGYAAGPMLGTVMATKGTNILVVKLENQKIVSANYTNFYIANSGKVACNNSFCVGDRAVNQNNPGTVVAVKKTASNSIILKLDSGQYIPASGQNFTCAQ